MPGEQQKTTEGPFSGGNMTGTNQAAEAESELTPEQILAAQKEGFDEALSTSRQVEAAPVVATEPEPEEHPEEPEAEARPAQNLIDAGWTPEKLEELAKKAEKSDRLQADLNKAFGKLGSIEHTLKQYSESAQGRELTEEDVSDLKAEYGEEMAAAMLKTLKKVVSKGAPKSEQPAEDNEGRIRAAVAETADSLRKENDKILLSLVHEDWREVTGVYDENGKWLSWQPKFAEWMKTLPQDEQDKLFSGWDVTFVSKKITAYKKHTEEQAKAAEEAEKKAKAEAEARKATPSRIKAAVAPKGGTVAHTQKSDLDWQREGYNEV